MSMDKMIERVGIIVGVANKSNLGISLGGVRLQDGRVDV